MSTPLVRQVKRQIPDATMHYLVGKHSAPILKRNPHLDKIIPFNEEIFTKRQITKVMQMVSYVRKQKYDIAFVLDKHWIFNLTAKLSGIPKRIGFDRLGKEGQFLTHKVYYGKIRHDVRYYLDLAREANMQVRYFDHQMEVNLSLNDLAYASAFWQENGLDDNVIGICPGGGKNPGQVLEDKIWPIEKYTQLIDELLKRNHDILLLGGPTDKAKEIAIRQKHKNISSAIGKSNLHQSAALMRRCSLVICNDSGPMHLAACVNKRVIGIFGPVHPERKAPLWPESSYVWKAKDIYDPDAETYGTFTKQDYLGRVSVEDILKLVEQ